MKQKINWKDNLYLAIPFIIMFILYQSSSMTYEEQSLLLTMESVLDKQPFYTFFSSIEFFYGENSLRFKKSAIIHLLNFLYAKGLIFFTYFIIGFFWLLGLRKRVRHDWLTIFLAILLAIGYASFDELRQSFNPGRTALMADVLLDTAGASVGVLLAKFLTIKKVL